MHGIRLEITPSKIASGPSSWKHRQKCRYIDHCCRLDAIHVIVFENLRSCCPRINTKSTFSKTSTLKSVTSVSVAENAVYMWTQEQNGQKIPFIKISAYVWTGPGLAAEIM